MDHEILHGPSYCSLHVKPAEGETIRAEAGAMVSMSSNMELKTEVFGSLLRALIRRLFGGESVFMNLFTPGKGEGEVVLSPTQPGEIVHRKLAGDSVMLQASAYLASSPEIDMKVKYGGVKTMLSGEGLFLLEVSGEGDLFFNSYGSIIQIPLDGDLMVDTGHVVGFDPSLSFKVKRVGGLKSTFLSGEGLVAHFSGKGVLYLQSRTISSLVGYVSPLLPQ